MTLGQKIRAARIERGMTQKQLVGKYITRNMLSKIENDSATPSVRTLEYLANQLQVDPGYFMNGSHYSNGTSPDGLDDMRAAYREGRYLDCIALLEASQTSATTDEGYLLRAKASLAAAKEALAAGNFSAAKELADNADYYNKEGIYYSAETDAEMSLVLAECALELDISEFEYNAAEYERAVKSISYNARYALAKAEYLRRTGEIELAFKLLASMTDIPEEATGKFHYVKGLVLSDLTRIDDAQKELLLAEELSQNNNVLLHRIYSALEAVYLKQEDYKMAHLYASKQFRE